MGACRLFQSPPPRKQQTLWTTSNFLGTSELTGPKSQQISTKKLLAFRFGPVSTQGRYRVFGHAGDSIKNAAPGGSRRSFSEGSLLLPPT